MNPYVGVKCYPLSSRAIANEICTPFLNSEFLSKIDYYV